ncbi:hypothetical protein EZV62_014739 [Acer yangbiense]|uniref:DUF4283 domain-containing protein n=1 Tax=Acer yangbiense TaxID=1000413 RepID=A0A5C7HV58_9ROSI|nr:hypothetical protein EZV62_014739 [Acer yangbiense]
MGKGDVPAMGFNKAVFWVQIYNAPMLCMTVKIARFMGSMIKEVMEVNEGKYGDCVGKYIRARMVVNVDKPLCRILWVDVMRDEKKTTMLLRVNMRIIPGEKQGVGELSKVDGGSKRMAAKGIGSKKTIADSGKMDFDNPCDSRKHIAILGEKSRMQNEMGSVPRNLNACLNKEDLPYSNCLKGSEKNDESQRDLKDRIVEGVMSNSSKDMLGKECLMISKVVGGLDEPYEFGASQQKHEGNIGFDISLETNVHVDMDIEMGSKNNLFGPKAGKWKRWARDRAKIDSKLESDTQLRKRILAANRDGHDKKLKIENNGNEACVIAFQVLFRLTQAYKPDVIFLMETKAEHVLIESIRIRLGFVGKLVMESVGKSGRLCLPWSDDVDISLLSYSNFHIDERVG